MPSATSSTTSGGRSVRGSRSFQAGRTSRGKERSRCSTTSPRYGRGSTGQRRAKTMSDNRPARAGDAIQLELKKSLERVQEHDRQRKEQREQDPDAREKSKRMPR